MSDKIFSKRMKELREQRHISMQQLADYLNVSKSSVNMWENAGVIPREPVLKKISQSFNVSIDYLLGNTTMQEEVERIEKLNDMNILFQQILGNMSEEDLEKVIQIVELSFTIDPSKKIDNFSERLKDLYFAVKEAKKYNATFGRIPTQEDNITMWESYKQLDELFSKEDDDENDEEV